MANLSEHNVLELSDEEFAARAERVARNMLGVSYAEALAMLDRGELDGTIAAAELAGLRHVGDEALRVHPEVLRGSSR